MESPLSVLAFFEQICKKIVDMSGDPTE